MGIKMGLFQLVLTIKIFFTLILVVPLLDSYKQSLISFFSSIKSLSTIKYVYFIALTVVTCVFAESVLDARSIRQLGILDVNYLSKLHKSYLTGFILLLALVIARIIALLRNASRLETSDEALKRQANSASQALDAVIKQQRDLEKENKALKIVLYGKDGKPSKNDENGKNDKNVKNGKNGKNDKNQIIVAFEEIKKLEEKLNNRANEIGEFEKRIKNLQTENCGYKKRIKESNDKIKKKKKKKKKKS